MELKREYGGKKHRPHFLLIVPYGIETVKEFIFTNCFGLLIVPYGIETALSCQCGDVEQGF